MQVLNKLFVRAEPFFHHLNSLLVCALSAWKLGGREFIVHEAVNIACIGTFPMSTVVGSQIMQNIYEGTFSIRKQQNRHYIVWARFSWSTISSSSPPLCSYTSFRIGCWKGLNVFEYHAIHLVRAAVKLKALCHNGFAFMLKRPGVGWKSLIGHIEPWYRFCHRTTILLCLSCWLIQWLCKDMHYILWEILQGVWLWRTMLSPCCVCVGLADMLEDSADSDVVCSSHLISHLVWPAYFTVVRLARTDWKVLFEQGGLWWLSSVVALYFTDFLATLAHIIIM